MVGTILTVISFVLKIDCQLHVL